MERTRRHALLDIIILVLCATLGNADGWADIERFAKPKLDFFRTFLDLPNGVLPARLQNPDPPGSKRGQVRFS
jgi:hypothetical protein